MHQATSQQRDYLLRLVAQRLKAPSNALNLGISLDHDLQWFSSIIPCNFPHKTASTHQFKRDYDELCEGLSRGRFFASDWSDVGLTSDDVQRVYRLSSSSVRSYIDGQVMKSRWSILAQYQADTWMTSKVQQLLLNITSSTVHRILGKWLSSLGIDRVMESYHQPSTDWIASWSDRDGGLHLSPVDHHLQQSLSQHDRAQRWCGPVDLRALPMMSNFTDEHDRRVDGHQLDDHTIVSSSLIRSSVKSVANRKNSVIQPSDRHVDVRCSSFWSYWTADTSRTSYPGVLIDVDRDDAMTSVNQLIHDGKIPTYSWAIVNHVNGHAQFCWQTPAWSKQNAGVMKLYSAVYHTLSFIMGGDRCFVGSRSQNPLWSGLGKRSSHREMVIPTGVYRLYALDGLKQWFVQHESWCPRGSMQRHHDRYVVFDGRSKATAVANGDASPVLDDHGMAPEELKRMYGSKADHIFNDTLTALDPRLLDGVIIPKGWRNAIVFRVATWLIWHNRRPETVTDYVHFHDDEHLSAREIASVCRKVTRYYRRRFNPKYRSASNHALLDVCRIMGRKGGLKRSKAQIETSDVNLQRGRDQSSAMASDRDASIWVAVLTRGQESRRSVSVRMLVSYSTLRRALQRVRGVILGMIKRKQVVCDHPILDANGQAISELSDCWRTPLVMRTMTIGYRGVMDAIMHHDDELVASRLSAWHDDLWMSMALGSRAPASFMRRLDLAERRNDGRIPKLNQHERQLLFDVQPALTS
jgi:hypothetical protein